MSPKKQHTVAHRHRSTLAWWPLLAALWLNASLASSGTTYQYETHATLSIAGATDAVITGINADRHLVGIYYDPVRDPWSYTKVAKTATTLLISGVWAQVQGLNDEGSAVGSVFRPTDDAVLEHNQRLGFQINSRRQIVYGGTGVAFESMDINNAGLIVGSYQPSQDEGWWCFVWNGEPAFAEGDGQFQPFVVDPAAEGCRVHDITDHNEMAGSHAVDGVWQGWVYRQGAYAPIIIAGADATWVENLLDNGTTHGTFRDATGFHGFARTATGEVTVLDVPGALETVVKGGNARGDVAGAWQYVTSDGRSAWGRFVAKPQR
jgi:hypothetical protein